MLRLNLIGGGQVGKTLAYLFTQQAGFSLQCVLNRSLNSASLACDFIGQGKAIAHYQQLTPADCYLLTVPDQQIGSCIEKLIAAKVLMPGNLVAHCSGFVGADILRAARSQQASIVSVHPVKSFVDPERSVQTFPGTFCGLEGDDSACALMAAWIEKIAGVPFAITANQKTIYHAALVIAANYLVVLHEAALRSLQKAGIDQPLSNQLLAPIMRHTLEQSLALGTTQALSGPIARGEDQVVATELQALKQWDPTMGELYQALAQVAAQIALRQAPNATLT